LVSSGGGHRIEADVGEEDRRRRTQHADAAHRAAPAGREERLEVGVLRGRHRDGDEHGQRDDLQRYSTALTQALLLVPSTSKPVIAARSRRPAG
jgi:predicted alpha-1,6-mannanase (GH76 family)